MRKVLVGMLMVGSLMFVGCANQEVPEDVTIESTMDEEDNTKVEEPKDDSQEPKKTIADEVMEGVEGSKGESKSTLPYYQGDRGDIPDSYGEVRCVNCDRSFYTDDIYAKCPDCGNPYNKTVYPKPIRTNCSECGREFVKKGESDPDDVFSGYCPTCRDYYSNKLPSAVDIYCDECGVQAVDPYTGICGNCGNDFYAD